MNDSQDKWYKFPGLMLASIIISSALVYLLILIVDPYDSVTFSPAWERVSVTSANRHFTAVVARKENVDSAVIGSSSSMLLDPRELDEHFGDSFVNLAMQAASPYEQQKTLSLFMRHHPGAKNIVLGLDHIWCQPSGVDKFVGFGTAEGFPEWLYDESGFNDLPPFNSTTIRHTRYQLMALLGLKKKYDRRADGYEDITLDLHHGRNDMASVRKRIYGRKGLQLRAANSGQDAAYPDIASLAAALAGLPASTRKMLFFAPPHQAHVAKPGSRQERLWRGCKTALLDAVSQLPLVIVVDFNIRSPITCEDANYVDGEHYRPAVASKLVERLAQVVLERDIAASAIDQVLLNSAGERALIQPLAGCP